MSLTYSVQYKCGMLAAFVGNQSEPLFMIMPDRNTRFFLQEKVLCHDSKTQTVQEIYHADSREDAMALLNAIYQEHSRRQNISSKIVGVFLILMIVGLFFISSQILANYFISYSSKLANLPAGLMSDPEPVKPQIIPAAPVSTAPVTDTEVNSLAIRAQSLQKAAASDRYTVSLSSGHPRTLYVFADPLCPHCREIEPTLEALTRDYNVEIFPVSVIGKQASSKEIIPVLCATPDKRASLWQSLFPGDSRPASSQKQGNVMTTSCSEGEHALAINDRAFGYYQLPGTPQLLADDGREIPFSALTSDDTLTRFINSPVEEPVYGQR
ncbi:hypothetical protein [Photorhabdus sp. RM71S]|uniref:hypothetical protein n=1 Tax=Photorhabdus sp. RM71S TaxID=3342824 RepID=UPI0036DDD6FF